MILCSWLAAGCHHSHCTNTVTSGTPSPDGVHIAFVFDRVCADTGEVSTHVSIIRFKDSLREGTGNALVAAGRQPFSLAWHSPSLLVVSHVKDARVARVQAMDAITVELRP